MALMPKRVKHRKSQRGRIRGDASRGNRVVFGDFGLQAEQPGWLAAATIEAGRIAASQYLRNEGRLFGLEAEVAEDDAVATRSVTSYTTSLAFSVLDPLGHQRHRQSPRTCLG